MNSLQIELRPAVRSDALAEDGLAICETTIADGALRTLQDLKNVITLGGEQTIIFIPREQIHPEFMTEVDREASDMCTPDGGGQYTKWNRSSGVSGNNAMPHIHPAHNCHVATKPSDCGTAFFRRKSVIDAVREVSVDRHRHCLAIREQLTNVLRWVDRFQLTDLFFHSLHAVEPPEDGGHHSLLECIHDIQTRVKDLGGLYEVNLGKDGYGIVSIPKTSVHGRSTMKELMRDHPTAWRYFKDTAL